MSWRAWLSTIPPSMLASSPVASTVGDESARSSPRWRIRSSASDGRTIGELAGLPGEAWGSFIVRDGQLVRIKGGTRLRPGDDVLVMADPDLHEKLTRAFAGPSVA
jgi:NhaP-type Na+/H+ and K+/H+ antiporter